MPAGAQEVLENGLDSLTRRPRAQRYGLPETEFTKEVKFYREKHEELNASGARPCLRREISESHAEEIALRISTGLKFLKLADGADPWERPILLYYSCSHICETFVSAFFDWEDPTYGHGLGGRPDGDGVDVRASGTFGRLVQTSFLLSGTPSVFTRFVSYSAKLGQNDGKLKGNQFSHGTSQSSKAQTLDIAPNCLNRAS